MATGAGWARPGTGAVAMVQGVDGRGILAVAADVVATVVVVTVVGATGAAADSDTKGGVIVDMVTDTGRHGEAVNTGTVEGRGPVDIETAVEGGRGAVETVGLTLP